MDKGRKDEWQSKQGKPRTGCAKKGGCTGSCPTWKLEKASKSGESVFCTVCGRRYPKLQQDAQVKEKPTGTASKKIEDLQEQLAKAHAKIKDLEKVPSDGGSGMADGDEGGDEDLAEKLKKAKAMVTYLEGVDDEYRDLLKDYPGQLEEARGKVRELDARVRRGKPLDVRVKQSQVYLKRCQAAYDKGVETASKLD